MLLIMCQALYIYIHGIRTVLSGMNYYSHFTDEVPKAQRD